LKENMDIQVARELRHLIDSLESQLNDYDRLVSDLEDEVSDLRNVIRIRVMALERRVRELEQGA
jgi:hypothetical protein